MRPTGTQATAALAAGKALTHQADPYLRLLSTLQTPGAPQLSYAREVAPWLGPHAGIFLTSLSSSSSTLLALVEQGLLGGTASGAFPFGTGGAQGAIVLDTSNVAKARSFIEPQARHAGAHDTRYRGVSYEATSSGVAFGVVDEFAVIGSEAGMHGVIETASAEPGRWRTPAATRSSSRPRRRMRSRTCTRPRPRRRRRRAGTAVCWRCSRARAGERSVGRLERVERPARSRAGR